MSNDNLPGLKVTSFDDIEINKENIVPLKQGRSASQLSENLRHDPSSLQKIKISYEQRLIDELEELDDPLMLYLEYIDWINNAYPQGGTSKSSGMLEVIERCLLYFKDFEAFKNDPRYFKLWLWYIELFTNGSLTDAKDIMVYLYRKKIGNKLALFYEEFSTILHAMNKAKEAFYILLEGVNENAMPRKRLIRKLETLKITLQNHDIDLSSNTQQREALISNVVQNSEEPQLILGRERSIVQNTGSASAAIDNNIRQDSNNYNSNFETLRMPFESNFRKLTIFQDDRDEENVNDSEIHMKKDGWNFIQSKNMRNKENKIVPTILEDSINAGKLSQNAEAQSRNDKLKHRSKISIFKDELGRADPVYKIISVPGKKTEKIDCNFDLLYSKSGEEFCIEEILAMSRKVYHIIDRSQDASKTQPLSGKRKLPIDDEENPKSLLPIKAPKTTATKPLRDSSKQQNSIIHSDVEYKLHTKTSILPLNDELGATVDKKPSNDPPNSPTVTMFGKNAMNEVYSMFNQNFKDADTGAETDETTSKFAIYENFTQEFTAQNLDDLTEVKTIGQKDEEKLTVNNSGSEKMELKENEEELKVSEKDLENHAYMTPIKEQTESLTQTQSSPFLTQPGPNEYVVENPISEQFRNQLLSSINFSFDTYSNYHQYNQPLKMSTLLKKLHKVSITQNKSPIVDFKKTGDLYCIRAKLGEGGYGTVYLAESSTGILKALKIEKPPCTWEFYILKQIQSRLNGEPILKSIINVDSLHLFHDESYLVLNYANQGTLLDMINHSKANSLSSDCVDENLCLFITSHLITVVTELHRIGIIHGDLKPDNCMIRFERNSNNIKNKGIYLIDFGRSFDMRLVPENTKFLANWKTDEQDCVEMQNGQPWSYESDYYGLANMVHCMLFGRTISLVGNKELKMSFKRYWKTQDVWKPLFELLLQNGTQDFKFVNEQLSQIRNKIDVIVKEKNNEVVKAINDLENELHTKNVKL